MRKQILSALMEDIKKIWIDILFFILPDYNIDFIILL